MDKYKKYKERGPLNCPFLNCDGERPKYNNFYQSDSLFEFLTGKPAQTMTDEQRREMNDRCHYMASSYYEDELNNLRKREIIADHAIKWLIAGLFMGYLVIGNIAWWLVGAGADAQTYSKQQIIERIEAWK